MWGKAYNEMTRLARYAKNSSSSASYRLASELDVVPRYATQRQPEYGSSAGSLIQVTSSARVDSGFFHDDLAMAIRSANTP